MNSSDTNWNYNKKLQPLANNLRVTMTKAEACLWKYVLRASMMKGYRFTRQRPVMNYIADFMCKELMLVIEVDGLTHDFKDVQDKDATNKKTLKEQVILYCDLQIMKCCLILRVLE